MPAYSLFYNLFHRKKLENFVTEILASSIRADRGPFLAVLRSSGVISPSLKIHNLEAQTQVDVPGAGVIDLVVYLDTGPKNAVEWDQVWVEVKVNSPESGNQLNNYTSYIAKQPKKSQPHLVTLAQTSLRKDIPALLWQDLYDAVGSKCPQYWSDLKLFLEELEMADEYGKPITSNEVKSLLPAGSLFKKVARILNPVCEHAETLFPEGKIPVGDVKIRRRAALQFGEHERITVHSTRDLWSVIIFGVAEGDLVVYVEPYSINAAWVRARILKQAQEGRLPLNWERSNDPGDWQILSVSQPLESFKTHDAASHWLVERLDEIKAAGIFKLIPILGEHPPEAKPDNESDE